jgi:hypothetical protein
MKKTSAFYWFLIIDISLSSCVGQGKQPVVLPSNTPEPSATVTLTQTMVRQTETLLPTKTATITPTSYPLKQVLLDYRLVGVLM